MRPLDPPRATEEDARYKSVVQEKRPDEAIVDSFAGLRNVSGLEPAESSQDRTFERASPSP